MASMDTLRIFKRGRGGGDYKGRIAVALREIEAQRKELDTLKLRLGERRQESSSICVQVEFQWHEVTRF